MALKSEAAQRFVRTVGAKQVQADYPLARLLDVEPSTSATAGAKSAGQKYLFTAEWRHKGQRASSTSSVATASAADHSGDCVALKAANGVYCSVERKDGSFSLASVMTPRDTELFTPVPVGDGRFALRSVYRTYVGLGEERGKIGTSVVARRLNEPTPNETFGLVIKVGVRLVGSGLICTCTKAGKFQAMGGETLGKSSCFLLEMGHQGAAFLTPNKRYLSVEMDGSVSALARTAGPQEMFTLQPHEDGEYRYYIKTWYGCYLRFRGGRNKAGDLIGDKKTKEEATCFQLIPLGVPAEELEQRSVSSQIISTFQPSSADEGEEASGQTVLKQDKRQLRQLVRTNTALSLSRIAAAIAEETAAPSTSLNDHLWPGEKLVLTLEDMAFLSKGTGQLGTVWLTNYHVIFRPQAAHTTDASSRTARGWRMARGWKISLGHISHVEEEEAQLGGKYFQFNIHLKDFNIIQLSTLPGSPKPADHAAIVVEKINQLCFPENPLQFVPYLHKQALLASSAPGPAKDSDSGHVVYDPQTEYTRLGLLTLNEGAGDGGAWRLSAANADYALSETYPSHIIVPRVITDEALKASAEYRSKGRLPAVVWRHPATGAVLVRCSQPRSGLTGVTCKEDESIVDAIRLSSFSPVITASSSSSSPASSSTSSFVSPLYTPPPSSSSSSSSTPYSAFPMMSMMAASVASTVSATATASTRRPWTPSGSSDRSRAAASLEPSIQIMDARPLMNALANQLAGAGMEKTTNYRKAKRKFLGIENIHVMRDALYRVAKLPFVYLSEAGATVPDFAVWLSQREETAGWLSHVSLLLSSAMQILECMQGGTTVIIHCSDGWDRTPQLTSLVQLLADDYYRSIEGFMCLIEKDWLSFGHKFGERIGHGDSNHKDKQRSPIFLQWIECVYQLVLQFPASFEFGESFLQAILDHSYSCLFGTFLFDCESERVRERTAAATHSLWTHLLDHRSLYTTANAQLPPSSDNHRTSGRPQEPLRPSTKDVRLWTKAHFPLFEPDNS